MFAMYGTAVGEAVGAGVPSQICFMGPPFEFWKVHDDTVPPMEHPLPDEFEKATMLSQPVSAASIVMEGYALLRAATQVDVEVNAFEPHESEKYSEMLWWRTSAASMSFENYALAYITAQLGGVPRKWKRTSRLRTRWGFSER